MRVLFRADASTSIGTGHWFRCRSLARALQNEGSDIRWCGRAPEGEIRQTFTNEFRLIILAPGTENSKNAGGGYWLPTTEAEDASLCQRAIEAGGEWRPDWIVVDHYGLSSLWHQQIRRAWPAVRIAVVDDLANRPLDPDLLIDHNTFVGNLADRYQPWLATDRDVGLCLGPEFALIDTFYSGFHGALPRRKQLQRLLISLGGAGDVQLLEKILTALSELKIPGLQIQLVQGGFARDSQIIQNLCEQMNVHQMSSLPTLAPLMASCDAAIGGGGTTTWERLCLGIPSITYALADNQEEYSKALGDQGLIQFLGQSKRFDKEIFKEAVSQLHEKPEYLQQQSAKSMELVDGKGCIRVARLMRAQASPDRWSELTSQELEGEHYYAWNDGLRLSSTKESQISSLRCLDHLELNRNSKKAVKGYLSSSTNRRGIKREIKRVTILSSRNSWMNNYIPILAKELFSIGCALRWLHNHQELEAGDVCFLLSYSRIVSKKWLNKHHHNLVVHASALPRGKGWSPMSWQILEGATTIPLTLFEATDELDAGPIHGREMLKLKGHELAPQWQKLQAEATIRLCSRWLKDYPGSADQAEQQRGEESFYERRSPEDSRLDLQRSLEDQFSLLQIVDNEAYPAFFERNGHRYRLRMEPW